MALKHQLGLYAMMMFLLLFVVSTYGEQSENCYSRFDYESKMLERIVMVEHDMSLLQKSTQQTLKEIKATQADMMNDLKIATKHLRADLSERQTIMSNELTMFKEGMANDTNAKFTEMTDVGNALLDTSKTLIEEQTAKYALMETDFNNLTSVLRYDVLKNQEESITYLTAFAQSMAVTQETALGGIMSAMRNMTALSEQLQEEQTVKLEAMMVVGNDMKVEIEEKMLALETEVRPPVEELIQAALNSTSSGEKRSAFTANTPAGGDDIRFTNIITDIGNDYSASTGRFTCRHPGIYFFALSIVKLRSGSPDRVSVSIRVNGAVTVTALTDPQDDSDGGSYETTATLTTRLSAGDYVDTRSGYSNGAAGMESSSHFSGFLMQSD